MYSYHSYVRSFDTILKRASFAAFGLLVILGLPLLKISL